MILEKYQKQPHEVKDYDVDYAPWLTPMGDTLDEVTGTVTCMTDPNDATLLVGQVSYTETRAKFWMSGGTSGQKYKLTILASTVGGRTDESELIFTVKDI